ncbi:Alpha/beta knot methyltransferase [Baffinella frigidus]|nr:Alpha/beta knot methyltransferase [Cryptophyta sp. CCMP2293]
MQTNGGRFVNVATCFTAKSKSMYQTELTAPNLALWIGNEFAGLSDEALKAADLEMFIPMRGMIQSLNLSVASAICLNEVTRQRMCLPGEGGEERWLLPQEEQNRLAADLHQRRRGFRPLSGERKTRLQKTWRTLVEKTDKTPTAEVNREVDYK